MLDTQQWIRNRLIHHWTAVSGHPPQQGGFTPKGETLERLESLLQSRGEDELDDWLKTSIEAFLHRSRGTETKFFVNSYLLSDSALEYLAKFRKQEGAYSSLPNNLNIRSKILISETDFLDTIMTIGVSRGSLDYTSAAFKPDLWWILAAEFSGRLKDVPGHWLEGTFEVVRGKRRLISEEYQDKKRELRSSGLLRELLLTEFRTAVTESTISWLESHRLLTSVSESGALVVARSDIDQNLLPPTLNPETRDRQLMEALKPLLKIRELEVAKPGAPVVVGSEASKLIQKTSSDPFVQKILQMTEED